MKNYEFTILIRLGKKKKVDLFIFSLIDNLIGKLSFCSEFSEVVNLHLWFFFPLPDPALEAARAASAEAFAALALARLSSSLRR